MGNRPPQMLHMQPLRRGLPGKVPFDGKPLFSTRDGKNNGDMQKTPGGPVSANGRAITTERMPPQGSDAGHPETGRGKL